MDMLITAAVLTAGLIAVILLIGRFSGFLKQNTGPIAVVIVSIVLVVGFIVIFYASPATRLGPEQPIPFSHRLHSGHKAIDCRYCHPYVERSNHPGLPPVGKCLHCHNYIIANHPEILKEHRYYNTNTPTPWREVFYLAEHVVFNHQRHIKKQIACESCHGEVRQMDRLKGLRFKMGFCMECHRRLGANIDCWLACHS